MFRLAGPPHKVPQYCPNPGQSPVFEIVKRDVLCVVLVQTSQDLEALWTFSHILHIRMMVFSVHIQFSHQRHVRAV
ncbi:hypothetical protein J6590_006078 [Homalodisca vitripennis]|nr:hypothetical protein J6590_006078 [Homalodisca vitripennis]